MEYGDEEKNLIVLCSFGELTYKAKYVLLSGLKDTSPDFSKNREKLIKSVTDGVYNKVKDKFYDKEYRRAYFKELEDKGITCVTYRSADYPELLKQTPYPPLVLYCKGNLKLLRSRCFTIVGSRRTPPNILKECRRFAGEISDKFTVVTGMADGADSAAAEGALKNKNVISVLANGFDYAYPAVNAPLIERVAREGLLVSEYTPDTQPRSYQFPARNRILAGLSEGALVVSAGKKSGALITAEYCLEYMRKLFAFPYNLGTAAGEGCNGLIRRGAALTQSVADIFEEFNLKYTPASVNITEEERGLLSEIRAEGEAFVPVLAEKLGMPPYTLIPKLAALEVKGLITRLGGNRYSANIE